jgi:hypothetical protein
MAVTITLRSLSSGPKTVPRQAKHRSAKAKAPRSGAPKECHGILPMRGPSHSSARVIRTLVNFRMRSC